MNKLFEELLDLQVRKVHIEQEREQLDESLREIHENVIKLTERIRNSPINVCKAELEQHIGEIDDRKKYPKSILNDERIEYLQKRIEYLQTQFKSFVSSGNYVIDEDTFKKLRIRQ